MSKYCIVADFFRETVQRGAELATDALIELLRPGNQISTRQSHTVAPDFWQDDTIYIISNRQNLNPASRDSLLGKNYIVYEHDAAWLRSRDFGLYEDFIPPDDQILNRAFYEGARKVVMQSHAHEYAINQALHLSNTVCAHGNPWSKSDIALLRSLLDTPKTEYCAILAHPHPSKGTDKAIDVAKRDGMEFKVVPQMPRAQYLAELAKFRFLIFTPQVFESYGRVAFETKCLGLSIITNDKLGFRYEDHAQLSGSDLIDFAEENNKFILSLFQ